MADDKNKDKSMSTAEAGRIGGKKVAEERGPEFYSRIGKQQNADINPGNFRNRPKKDVQEAGRKGGQARGEQTSTDREDMEEAA